MDMGKRKDIREILGSYTIGSLGFTAGLLILGISMRNGGFSLIGQICLSICIIMVGLCAYILVTSFEDLVEFLEEVVKKYESTEVHT